MKEGRWRNGELLAGAHTRVELIALRDNCSWCFGCARFEKEVANNSLGWWWRSDSSPLVRGLAVVPESVASTAQGSLGSDIED